MSDIDKGTFLSFIGVNNLLSNSGKCAFLNKSLFFHTLLFASQAAGRQNAVIPHEYLKSCHFCNFALSADKIFHEGQGKTVHLKKPFDIKIQKAGNISQSCRIQRFTTLPIFTRRDYDDRHLLLF